MAYLTRSEIIDRIIRVLREYGNFVSMNREYFLGKYEIIRNVWQNGRITQNVQYMRRMLRKLDNNSLVEMYKKCAELAEKYKLRAGAAMSGYNDVVLSSATNENDVYYIDNRGIAGFYMGWEYQAPQAECGYANDFDKIANEAGFNIHGTRFVIGENVVLRLWKGFYGGVIGGEIGFYGELKAITNGEMKVRLYNTIEQFLALIGVRADVEYLMGLPPEELKRELLRLILSSNKLKDNNGRPLREQVDIIEKIRELFFSPEQFILKIPSLMFSPTPLEVITFLIMTHRVIRIIVEIKKLSAEMDDDAQTFSGDWGRSLSGGELNEYLGLTGTAVQVFYKRINVLVAEHQENGAKFWTTTFALDLTGTGEFYKLIKAKDLIYTVNHFYFKNKECADFFHNEIKKPKIMDDAFRYEENKSGNDYEKITIPEKPNDTTVIILYGK
jgi:hypothetical protein